jgi:hypothetical protein
MTTEPADTNPVHFRADLPDGQATVHISIYDDGKLLLCAETGVIVLSLAQRRMLQKISEQF